MSIRVDHRTGELKPRPIPKGLTVEAARARLEKLDQRNGVGVGAASERAMLEEVLAGRRGRGTTAERKPRRNRGKKKKS